MKASPSLSIESLFKFSTAIYMASLFFSDTFLPSLYVRYGSLILMVLLAFVCSLQSRAKLCIDSPMIWWILFFVFALLNCFAHNQMNAQAVRWFLPFGCILTIIVMLGHSNGRRMFMCIPGFIVVFATIHAGITVLCWALPQIYEKVIYPLFFSDVSLIVGRGYQSAFTAHYSTNAVYITLGLLCLPAIAKTTKRRNLILLYALLGIALILTAKRAHTAFTLIGIIAAWFAMSSRKIETLVKIPVLVVGVALCVIALAQWFPELNALVSRFADAFSDDTFGGRSEFYDLCIRMWEDSPLFGNGWGSYTVHFNQTALGAEYLATGFTTMTAHEVYLQVLAENGVVGFLLFAFALFASFRTVTVRANDIALETIGESRLWPSIAEKDSCRNALFCGVSLQVFFLLYCFTGNPLYDEIVYAPFLLLLLVNLGTVHDPLKNPALSYPAKWGINEQTA